MSSTSASEAFSSNKTYCKSLPASTVYLSGWAFIYALISSLLTCASLSSTAVQGIFTYSTSTVLFSSKYACLPSNNVAPTPAVPFE